MNTTLPRPYQYGFDDASMRELQEYAAAKTLENLSGILAATHRNATVDTPKDERYQHAYDHIQQYMDAQRAIMQEYADAMSPVNIAALYGDDVDTAMLELARVVYTVAEHFAMPYVTATAFYHDRYGNNRGHAYGQVRDTGEFTETMTYRPEQEDEK